MRIAINMERGQSTTLQMQLSFPSMVNVQLVDGTLHVKGPQGSVSRFLQHPQVLVTIGAGMVTVSPRGGLRGAKAKMLVHTYTAHIQNMLLGVVSPFVYELKICSGHFPMAVTVKGEEFEVKNFFGEKVPRRAKIPSGVKVVVNAEQVLVTSTDREAAGMVAGRIEQLCRITNRDRRIFMDGIWITKKAGKEMLV